MTKSKKQQDVSTRQRAEAASVTLTLRLKVRPESHAWLNAAAVEVNQTWNILARAKVLASVSGNESSDSPVPSSRLHGRCEAGTETARTTA